MTRPKLERHKEQKLMEIKTMALELKGSYFVANIMTNTYVEVSKRYIIPGVAHTDRLTLPDTTPMSREACVQKIEEVGQLAKEARMNISHLANTRRKQCGITTYQKRGEIGEIEGEEN